MTQYTDDPAPKDEAHLVLAQILGWLTTAYQPEPREAGVSCVVVPGATQVELEAIRARITAALRGRP